MNDLEAFALDMNELAEKHGLVVRWHPSGVAINDSNGAFQGFLHPQDTEPPSYAPHLDDTDPTEVWDHD